MDISMIRINAKLNLLSFNVDKAPKYYGCKVCGSRFKTEYGQYNHIDRKDHADAVENEMNRLIEKELKQGLSEISDQDEYFEGGGYNGFEGGK